MNSSLTWAIKTAHWEQHSSWTGNTCKLLLKMYRPSLPRSLVNKKSPEIVLLPSHCRRVRSHHWKRPMLIKMFLKSCISTHGVRKLKLPMKTNCHWVAATCHNQQRIAESLRCARSHYQLHQGKNECRARATIKIWISWPSRQNPFS